MKVRHAKVIATTAGLIALPVSHVLISLLAPDGLPGHRVHIGGYLMGFCLMAFFLFVGLRLILIERRSPDDTMELGHFREAGVMLILILALITHAFIVPTVSQRKLDRLNKSMPQAEVLDLLGSPNRKVGPNGGAWHYSTFLRLGYVHVFFDSPRGNFHGYEYEE